MQRLCAFRVRTVVLTRGLPLGLFLAVALTCALPRAALAGPQAEQAPIPREKAKPEAKKTKKVWTNDNLQDLSGKSGVSVVGGASSTDDKPKAETKPADYAQGKDPDWYRNQIASRRAEIDRLDQEITKTREFINGGHTAEGRLKVNVFSVPMNPADHIAQLEKRKATVQNEIDALEDQARRNDIPPGALR